MVVRMSVCRIIFWHPENMAKPTNLAEAEAMGPGITPIYASGADLVVDVERLRESCFQLMILG